MNKTFLNYLRPALAGVFIAALAACGGGGGGSADVGNGTLRLALTDAPACGFDKVFVTVEKVRVHQSSSAEDTPNNGWSEVILEKPKKIDLLSLTNGALFELGQTPLPAGKYSQLRLVLADNKGIPLANSVVPTGTTTEVELNTPSAQQSGLKIPVNFTVGTNELADLVLDFDACKSVSVVTAGNSTKYNLKPILRLIPRLVNGVEGFVDSALANVNTSVTLQQAGVALRSTVPDSNGKFVLQPVVPGTYTLVLTAPNRITAVVNSVPISTSTVIINTVSTRFNPATSSTGTLTGTVSTGATPIDAMVRALQTLTSGSKIEVISRLVDGGSGAYNYVLPTAAPQAANYVVDPTQFVFSPAGAAGKYTLEATSGGVVKTSAEQTVSANATTTVPTFTFP